MNQLISLQAYNTFGINAFSKEIIHVKDIATLKNTVKQYKNFKVLGGGSNILLKNDLPNTTILKMDIEGINLERTFKRAVYVSAGAGVIWHDLVLYALENNFGGIENLSLIPGTVGACPIQNIGAYGVEIKDVFHKLKAVHVETGRLKTFYTKDCNFGYRDSVFKRSLKGQYIIVEVWFKLSKPPHKLNLNYGAIRKALSAQGIKPPTIQNISTAIIDIRQNKLPDPKQIGNSGSFFKNPIIDLAEFEHLKEKYDNIPNYPQGKDKIKLAAGWLIEQCGWKGKRISDAGVHDKQALVLVNYGKASGQDIFALAEAIQTSVYDKFKVKLEMEVNVWG